VRALSATYYSEYAREWIAEAQQAVEAHTTCAYTGVCLGCGRPGVCDELLDAQRTLARYGRLPHRRPGASLTGPASQRRGGFAWFAGRPDLGPETTEESA
jgi:hypothetical protein